MLACRGLTKQYETDRGPVAAVRSVDLDIESGCYAAIVGRSGSGKSSLLGMIGGLSRPTGGRVLIGGTDIWALSEAGAAAFRNARIGFVFQFASLLPNLRALDNVALPARLAGTMSRRAILERALERLADVGLDSHAEAFPFELSSGEQRRVAIARALMNDPALLLGDEPTSDLDEQTEREIMALLRDISRSRGTTLVLVTHNLALAAQAQRIVHIADGVVVP
ncbi:putative ABC transport system ATP-binding protein [Ancylobacter aquaticus]|uniref:Putative ABC transport system ATP-binding protein n=1 Tax=Ancylobacter aquaticus TaxID=100 RepID=A0A4R1I677_ANCAQ|nr:ABC transporter ATP-binding protein [Ancylobacter aquaticus]TCK28159.1 putative ABC transport system ATP-binding protein [Ancylobacter aquaticus]